MSSFAATDAAWGISGPTFLWAYAIIAVAIAVCVGWAWRRTLGPRALASGDPDPDIGTYELALLAGGPQLAITSAAAQLHRDGRIDIDNHSGALTICGEVDPEADELERAVYETVLGEQPVAAVALRAHVAEAEPLPAMQRELRASGLLLEEHQTRRLRRLWLAGLPLLAVGAARIVEVYNNGQPLVGLLIGVAIVFFTTRSLARVRPFATRRGRDVLHTWRAAHDGLRERPSAADGALAAALFGGATLWLAEPALASALGVPRTESTFGGGGGGCSAGDGGGGGGCGGCGGCG